VGGLGHLAGDQGSGHDLGRNALRAVALAEEGLGPATLLVERLRGIVGAGPDGLSRWASAASPSDVAALAPLVLDAAKERDAVARRLVREGAELLAQHVNVLAKRLPGRESVPVAFGGGLLSKRRDYRLKVTTRLKRLVPGVTILRTPVDGAAGAVRLAMRLGARG
jgi:N-acetylglucosamine kinase-like BadF-type ATPase